MSIGEHFFFPFSELFIRHLLSASSWKVYSLALSCQDLAGAMKPSTQSPRLGEWQHCVTETQEEGWEPLREFTLLSHVHLTMPFFCQTLFFWVPTKHSCITTSFLLLFFNLTCESVQCCITHCSQHSTHRSSGCKTLCTAIIQTINQGCFVSILMIFIRKGEWKQFILQRKILCWLKTYPIVNAQNYIPCTCITRFQLLNVM